MAVKLSVRLSDEEAEAVRRMAASGGQTQSDVIRDAVRAWAMKKPVEPESAAVIDLLREQVEDLRAQNERLTGLLDHAQQTTALAVQKLALPEGGKKRKRG